MPADREILEEERRFLVSSLVDAETEHDAGDLTDEDHVALRDRDTARLADVLRALDDIDKPSGGENFEAVADHVDGTSRVDRVDGTGPVGSALIEGGGADDTGASSPEQSERQSAAAGAGAPSAVRARSVRRRRQRALVVGAVTAFVAAAGILVVEVSSNRLPGDLPSGSVKLSQAEQVQRELLQAADLEGEGNDAEALQVYHQVLQLDPEQSTALAEQGWLEYEAGVSLGKTSLVTAGEASVEASIAADATGFAGYLYLGTMEMQVQHDPAQAVANYRKFLDLDPPASTVAQARPFLEQAFAAAGLPLPVAAGGSSTSSPTGPSGG